MTGNTLHFLQEMKHKTHYECLIGRYQIGHSHMVILIRNRKSSTRELYYVTFEDVRYFSGPFRWMGLDLTIGSKSECWEKLAKFNVFQDEEKFHEKSTMRLYKFAIEDSFAEIIAGNAYMREGK